MARKAIVDKEIVLSMLKEGVTTQGVAEKYNVSRQAIDLYRKDFIKKGLLPDRRAARTVKLPEEITSGNETRTEKAVPQQSLKPSGETVTLDKQIDLLRDYRPDLRDRDMVVLSTTGTRETTADIGYVAIPRGTARQLRRQFEPASTGLTVILIGKDGGEKARWQHVVEPQEIFDLIDSMPMRRQELNETVETQ